MIEGWFPSIQKRKETCDIDGATSGSINNHRDWTQQVYMYGTSGSLWHGAKAPSKFKHQPFNNKDHKTYSIKGVVRKMGWKFPNGNQILP